MNDILVNANMDKLYLKLEPISQNDQVNVSLSLFQTLVLLRCSLYQKLLPSLISNVSSS